MELAYNIYRQVEGTAVDTCAIDLTEEEYKDFLEKQEELDDLELLEYIRVKYQVRERYVDTEIEDQGGEIDSVEFITD